MKLSLLNVQDVAENQLCTGCGACAFASPAHVEMVDTLHDGRRPRVKSGTSSVDAMEQAMAVCPGIEQHRTPHEDSPGAITSLFNDWGPVLEIWEGFATDPEIRFRGSSGGVITALGLFAVERGAMKGVLHVKARKDQPLLNTASLSRSRAELMEGSGSRYAPASPCEHLGLIEDAQGPCVFVGKPCDVTGAIKAAGQSPRLKRNIGLTIGFFCAGTPSTASSLDLLRAMGVYDPARVGELRYRGAGWPGEMGAKDKEGGGIGSAMSYEKGWGEILQKGKAWRCQVCADHTGEFADLSVGDPWYRPTKPGDHGRSLILVRSERGRQMLRAAMRADYVRLERCESWVLPASQAHLLRARASVWGRSLASRLLGVAAPRQRGFGLFRSWLRRLSLKEKVQSIVGTAKRIWAKALWRRREIHPIKANAWEGSAWQRSVASSSSGSTSMSQAIPLARGEP